MAVELVASRCGIYGEFCADGIAFGIKALAINPK